MQIRIIKVYYTPLSWSTKYFKAFALDEDDNLVWVSKYDTDDPVLLDEIDDWFGECERDIPDVPVPLHKLDYDLDYNSEDRRYIGEITLRYVDEEQDEHRINDNM